MKITDIKPNESNPRTIKEADFKKLKKSIKGFEKMMGIRPIVVDEDGVILGGNMRYRAIVSLGYTDIPDEWVKVAVGLTEDEKKEFIIRDNVGFGEWDFDMLANEWDEDLLSEWGVDLPIKTATELLSDVSVSNIYYTPRNIPQIRLNDCVNLDKFNAKIKAIEESNLSDEQKEVLKLFAYRFIRIDFEGVANYYAFNASEDEKRVIERLRLVLVDGGINGFIEDDLLRINDFINDEE